MTNTPIHDKTIRSRKQPEPTPHLTAHDRCDTGKCDSQAYVEVYFTADSTLLFCGHHWAEKRKAIGDVFDVMDETHLINKARDKE